MANTSDKNADVAELRQQFEQLKAEDLILKKQLILSQRELLATVNVTPGKKQLTATVPEPKPTISATPAATSPSYQTVSKWTRLDTGMSKTQVREILGPPTSTTTLGKGLEIWHYGFSSVNFESDKVTEWTRT